MYNVVYIVHTDEDDILKDFVRRGSARQVHEENLRGDEGTVGLSFSSGATWACPEMCLNSIHMVCCHGLAMINRMVLVMTLFFTLPLVSKACEHT